MKINFKSNIFLERNKFEFISIKKDKNFHSLEEFFKIKINTRELKKRIQFILSLISDFSCEVSIKFCDTHEMIETNSHFRKKNYPTDVLSFPNQSHDSSQSAHYLGDILICIPVCAYPFYKKNFILKKHDFENKLSLELEKMIVHGLVHLKGFDHERSDAAWRVMSALEVALHKEISRSLASPAWCSVLD